MLTIPANVQAHLNTRRTWPIELFIIGGSPILYYTSGDKAVFYGGHEYQPFGIRFNRAEHRLGLEVNEAQIVIDNMDEFLIAWVLTVDPTGYYTSVLKGFTDGTVDGSNRLLLIENFAQRVWYGRNTAIKADEELEIVVKSSLDMHRQLAPRSSQDVTCRFRGAYGFKGINCGYSGPETTCDYSQARCRQLGNFHRFGGFPTLSEKTDS